MSIPRVLLIGLQPALINFSDPAYAAFPGMTAEKIQARLDKDVAALNGLGYAAELCLVDFGETAEAVLRERFERQSYDCVLVGAGVRLIASNKLLFEKLINVVHERGGKPGCASTPDRPIRRMPLGDGFHTPTGRAILHRF